MKAKVKFTNQANCTLSALCIAFAVLTFSPLSARAQSCQTASDLEEAARTAITVVGQRFYSMVATGDVATLRRNANSNLVSDFSVIETTVKDHQQDLAGAPGTVKSVFLLEAEGAAPVPHAEFYCGVFNKNGQTSGSSVFYLDNLPPGNYAVVLFDATSAKGRTMLSFILQQAGTDWKLGGLYIKPAQVAGHDSDWFLTRAREYKTRGQMHNAWLFYEPVMSLISPLNFMSTLAIDKLYDESRSVKPADLPADGKTVDLPTGTATYKLTAMFPEFVGNDLDVIVKYQAADISNTNQAYQSNIAVIKAVVAKYPEIRNAFAGVEARAADSSGRDYGTLLAMKDVK
jgi:hypothetical protein